MRRVALRTLLCAMALLAIALLPVRVASQDSANRAGLIVIHGDGRTSWSLVTFSEARLSGVELLHRSGFEVTEVTFGALGVGVCSIDETGCDVSVCRQRVCQGAGPEDPYWQYFIAGSDGTWHASPLGVSSDTVSPGDVRAFIWSNDPPEMVAPTIGEIEQRALDVIGPEARLTRYAADGSVLIEDSGPDREVPAAGLLVIAGAMGLVVLTVVRSRRRLSA